MLRWRIQQWQLGGAQAWNADLLLSPFNAFSHWATTAPTGVINVALFFGFLKKCLHAREKMLHCPRVNKTRYLLFLFSKRTGRNRPFWGVLWSLSRFRSKIKTLRKLTNSLALAGSSSVFTKSSPFLKVKDMAWCLVRWLSHAHHVLSRCESD